MTNPHCKPCPISSLWYFIVVWTRSKRFLQNIKSLFCNLDQNTQSKHYTLGQLYDAQINWWFQSYFAKACYESSYEQMDYPSFTSWPIKLASIYEVLLCSSKFFTMIFGVVHLFGSSPLMWIQRLAPHHSILEGDGKYGCVPLNFNFRGHFGTSSLVEGGISTCIHWSYYGKGFYLVLKKY